MYGVLTCLFCNYSKEDEEILKSEYGRNPKPDKAARIQIVSQVALSEKEVQVWSRNPIAVPWLLLCLADLVPK